MVILDVAKKIVSSLSFEILTVVILTLVFGSVWGSPFYGTVNVIDEGQFGAWINHMLNGKLMYEDIFITYGPLLVYPLYILSDIFGPSIFLVRLYLTCGSSIGIILVIFLLRVLRISSYLRLCTIVVVVLLPMIQLRQAGWLLFLLLLILSFQFKKPLLYMFTGISIVCSFLISPEVGIYTLVVAVVAFIYQFIITERMHPVLSHAFYMVGGALFAIVLFVVWSYSQGWLSAYLFVTYDTLFGLSGGESPNGQNFPNLINLILQSKPNEIIKVLLSREALLYWEIIFYFIVFYYLFVKVMLRKVSSTDFYIFLLFLFLNTTVYNSSHKKWLRASIFHTTTSDNYLNLFS